MIKKDDADVTRRTVASALPFIFVTVYARTTLSARMQNGSPIGSIVPSGDPSGTGVLAKKPAGGQSSGNPKKPGGGQVYP